MSFRLYSYWRSSSAWRVRIGLRLKGIDFEYRTVDLLGGEQYGEAHRARNPMCQVPVLEVEEGGRMLRLAQSMAILEWLEERFPSPPLLPSGADGRARVRRLAEHVNAGIQPFQNAAVLKWIRERLAGADGEWAAHWIGRGLDALEAEARQGAGRFSHGDAVTLADVYLVPQLFGARRFHLDLSRWPTLLGVEAACRELPAFRLSEPDLQPDAPPPAGR